MFDTYILPILEYNIETWAGKKPVNDLEKLQLGCLNKNTSGVTKLTNINGLGNVRQVDYHYMLEDQLE